MVEVAALAATAAVVLDSVAITATRWRIRSAANSGNLSSFPWAQRNSIATFLPSTRPASLKPLRNPASRLAFGSGEPECRNPMTGIAACCACADERPRDRTSSDKRDEIAPPHAFFSRLRTKPRRNLTQHQRRLRRVRNLAVFPAGNNRQYFSCRRGYRGAVAALPRKALRIVERADVGRASHCRGRRNSVWGRNGDERIGGRARLLVALPDRCDRCDGARLGAAPRFGR